MSAYAINKVCYLIQTDIDFRERMRRDPAGALSGLPLTDEERQAFLDWDVAKLYQAGAHSFLLSRLARFGCLGMSRTDYIRSMRTLLSDNARLEVESRRR